MKYALQDLLNIRALREQAAGEVVTRQRHRVTDAIHEVEAKKDDLTKYREWRLKEEGSLYGSVIGKPILLRHLNDVRSAVSWLRDAELLYEKKIVDAETALETERTALTEAQVRQKAADRDLKRIEEHEKLWLEEWAKEQDLNLEREMEDLHLRVLNYSDDDEEASEDESD